ncbi:hypothetical protein OFB80_30970, partial [Escherichia coli]|nr:hypothetical protein [Escherichia coli]
MRWATGWASGATATWKTYPPTNSEQSPPTNSELHELRVVKLVESRWDGWPRQVNEKEIENLERVGMLHRR